MDGRVLIRTLPFALRLLMQKELGLVNVLAAFSVSASTCLLTSMYTGSLVTDMCEFGASVVYGGEVDC